MSRIILLCFVLSFSSCIKVKNNAKKKNVITTQDPQDNNAQAPQNNVANIEVGVGVKNFEQIHVSMARVTGVNPVTSNIELFYKELKEQLPANNDIKSFTASQQTAIVKLATEYCDELIDDSNLRQQKFPSFNFASAASTAFSASGKAYLKSRMVEVFWGQNLNNLPDTSMLESRLETLISDLLVGENMGSSVTTRKVSKGLCITVLASAPTAIL